MDKQTILLGISSVIAMYGFIIWTVYRYHYLDKNDKGKQ